MYDYRAIDVNRYALLAASGPIVYVECGGGISECDSVCVCVQNGPHVEVFIHQNLIGTNFVFRFL